ETSSLRSNPLKLAEFTLSRKDPNYVHRAKEVQKIEKARESTDKTIAEEKLTKIINLLPNCFTQKPTLSSVGFGSTIFARKPGDGSAREQAASCQKVLGGWANIACEYATKRYRSNLINWGMLPFLVDPSVVQDLSVGAWLVLPHIRTHVIQEKPSIQAYLLKDEQVIPITLQLHDLTHNERSIILAGCLINFYAQSGV
ncbi:MAG: hydratase, partial [Desulfovibrio sp.]|nr:hydratase [Desulfovibrio sp.]